MNYLVKNADLEKDEVVILNIWRGNIPDSSAGRFKTIYINNPYGLSWAWLSSTDSEEVIGAAGLCQRKVFISGEAASSGVAIDFAILKEHRGFGPALKLQREVTTGYKKNGLDFIYAFPNQQAESVFNRVRYKSIGKMARWVKVLRTHYKLKDVLKSETLSRIFSPVVDIAVTKVFKERTYRRPGEVKTEVTNAFDSRFDILWELAKDQFAVIGERTTVFLNWRYGRFLKDNCRIFCLSDRSETNLLGYIVYRLEENICHIDDLLFLNSPSVIDTLLAEFISFMRCGKAFAISLSYLGSSAVIGKFEQWGFVRREAERSIMVFADESFSQAPVLLDKENWHLLEGDDI